MIKNKNRAIHPEQNLKVSMLFIVLAILLLSLSGCNLKPSVYKIGLLTGNSSPQEFLNGFQEGLTNIGYIENKNVTYLKMDQGKTSAEDIRAAASSFLAKKVHIVFAASPDAAKIAKEVFSAAKTPIVFCPVINPDKEGLVMAMRKPGGNITGVTIPDTTGNTMSWAIRILPELKKLYVPVIESDPVGMFYYESLKKICSTMNIEIVTASLKLNEEMESQINKIPAKVDAVFIIRSNDLLTYKNTFIEAAFTRKIPVISTVSVEGAVVSFGIDHFKAGELASVIVDKIFKGSKPAFMAVEYAEPILTINLKAAAAIGLSIPDSISSQAKVLIRP